MSGSNRTREHMLRVVDGEQPRGSNPFVGDRDPFVALGNLPGTGVAFLDSHDALQQVTARDLSRNNLQRFFSAQPLWLVRTFPRPKKGQNSDEADSFAANLACDRILNACGHEGPWDPKQRLRGRGAWLGEDNDLILHCGDKLWVNGRMEAAGRRGERIYPKGPPLMRPHRDAQPAYGGPGEQLFGILDKWRWKQPELDQRLMLGWIGAALIGGALQWRPSVWVTGLRGSGKSMLVDMLVCSLFDNKRSLLFSTNTTPAGLWQMLAYDSIPIILDESEPDIDRRRLNALVEMMRISFGGGDVQRGSSEGTAHQYPVRSSFLFSSINVPDLKPQDRSRCAVLELQPLVPGEALMIAYSEMPALGRALLRRMVDHWARLPDVLEAFREELIKRGWDGRGADTFGTLLACANILLSDECYPEHDLEGECGAELEATLQLHRQEELPDHGHMINHLRGAFADPWRGGERRPLGELVRQAAGFPVTESGAQGELEVAEPAPRSEAQAQVIAERDSGCIDANRTLMAYGMKVMGETDRATGQWRRYVAVANQSSALNELLRGTHWAGQSGAAGMWRRILSRVPGAQASTAAVYFRDGNHRAVLVPLETFLGEES
jgi:hypothetical protein